MGTKLCVDFLLFLFWKELWRFKVKEFMCLVEPKHINKNETESKMENPTLGFREMNHVFHSARIKIANEK